MYIISVVISTAVAMVIHELGHLCAARMCGVPASELGIGVGPKLFDFRVGATRYTLRAAPVASYVRLKTIELQKKPLPLQLFVHLAGVIANLIAAFAAQGTTLGWVNLLVALANLLPIYQHDGWKCGVVLMRALIGRKSTFVEWTFTLSGGFISLTLLPSIIHYI